MANKNLTAAKKAKQAEFYTQIEDHPAEEWRHVPGMGHLACEASSLGRVRAYNAHPMRRRVELRIPGEDGHGQLRVGIGGKEYRVHRLVCAAFHGPCPAGRECAHGNGNHRDNTPSNLRWATHQENIDDKATHGTGVIGENHKLSKLDDDTVTKIRAQYESGGYTQEQLSAYFGVHQSTISQVVLRKTWKHLS